MARDTKEKKERKKKLRGVLLLFQKQLEKTCATLETASQWYKLIHEKLDPILKEYHDDLPVDLRTKLKDAAKLVDETSDGIGQTCEALHGQIGKTVQFLAPKGMAGTLMVGAFVLGALAVGAAIVYINMSAVEVVVANHGCQSMNLTSGVRVNLPGLSLPQGPIPSGGQATIKVPRLTATVDATTRGEVTISALRTTITFQLDPGVTLTFDGNAITNKRTTVDLGKRSKHDVIVSCRQPV